MSVPCFFYGSYMDPDILRKFGANPGQPVPTALPGWRLTFTPHANLVRDDGATAHGVRLELPQDELDKLYGPTGFVTTYIPIDVDTDAGPMTTFIEEAPEGAPEPGYLEALLDICRRMELPDAYIAEVEAEAQRLRA